MILKNEKPDIYFSSPFEVEAKRISLEKKIDGGGGEVSLHFPEN